ncbi:RasGEF domain-containing protein, partial [Reticulomyxa filosa]
IDTKIYLQIEIRGTFFFFFYFIYLFPKYIYIYVYISSNLLPDEDLTTPHQSPTSSPFLDTKKPLLDSNINSALLSLSSDPSPRVLTSITPNRDTPKMVGNQLHESPLHKLERSKIDAPNLLYMIDHVNRLSLWVATTILKEKAITKQIQMCKYFYLVAYRCLQLNNIHSCTAIFGGIGLEPVDRLKRMKRLVLEDPTVKQYHDGFVCLLNTEKNYKFYRKILEKWFKNQQLHIFVNVSKKKDK